MASSRESQFPSQTPFWFLSGHSGVVEGATTADAVGAAGLATVAAGVVVAGFDEVQPAAKTAMQASASRRTRYVLESKQHTGCTQEKRIMI